LDVTQSISVSGVAFSLNNSSLHHVLKGIKYTMSTGPDLILDTRFDSNFLSRSSHSIFNTSIGNTENQLP
jgi:hypothetical protein